MAESLSVKLLSGLNPREHLADLGAGGLDLVGVDGLTLLEEPLVVVLAVGNELLGELAVLDRFRMSFMASRDCSLMTLGPA